MKKIIKITYSVLLGLFINSCSNDNEESNYRLKEEIFQNGDVTTYSYNKENQLNKISDAFGTTLGIYNSQGLLTNVNYVSTSGNASFDTVITYLPSGLRLESITTYSNGSKEKSVYTESNGVILKRDDFEFVGGVWVSQNQTIYYDSNKRIIQAINEFSNSLFSYNNGNCIDRRYFEKQTNGNFLLKSKIIFEYDDKNNSKRYDIDDDDYDADDIDYIRDKNKNNIKSETFINYKPDGITIDSQNTSQTNYEYNEAGYVIKVLNGSNSETTYILETY